MADPPGTFRRIDDLEAEADRLGRERQISAGQICAERSRTGHCPEHRVSPRDRAHDPDHCDRVWIASRG